MEPDELVRHIALKDQCTDFTTEIYPHYKDLYPGGVKEMPALDPELSEEARAVKIRWFEKVLERLLKLQSRIASSATTSPTSNVQPPISGNVHCATSSFTPSTFLLTSPQQQPMLLVPCPGTGIAAAADACVTASLRLHLNFTAAWADRAHTASSDYCESCQKLDHSECPTDGTVF